MGDGDEQPALQVIVLGSGGGPKEDNTTAFLVRSASSEWKRGSILAVDAGTHLAAIVRILEPYLPDRSSESDLPRTITAGPFAGLELPHVSASANAAHITRSMIDTYLITHPHLDHISGFVVNTASLPGSRPKRLAGLPSTIAAFKTHIFNNVIWPNLSDENDGAGLVTYMRLVDGGSPALGAGEGKGYVEMCDGLSVKTWSVSHGHCMENHSHRGSSAGVHTHSPHDSFDLSLQRSHSNPMTSVGFGHHPSPSRLESHERVCVYDSSAYFIRDIATGREVLMFGDVEPDSISLSPRNLQVWSEAAPKIASGLLKAVFIECSYDDSQTDDTLFGHLAPRFLNQELLVLAEQVARARNTTNPATSLLNSRYDTRKRKRPSDSVTSASPHSYSSTAASTPSLGLELDGGGATRPRYTPIPPRRSGTPDSSSRLLHAISPTQMPQPRRVNSTSLSPSSHPQTFDNQPLDPFEMDGLGQGHGHEFSPPLPPSNLTDRSIPPTAASTSSSTVPTPTLNNVQIPSSTSLSLMGQLAGLRVIIIHVKDKLNDGPPVEDIILRQLHEYEEKEMLGTEFVIASVGMSVFL